MTTVTNVKPKVSPGGLVTISYLKARLDKGEDHLGIFMPLVIDVLPGLLNRHFTAAQVQEAIAAQHGVAMPQEAIITLLKRAARKRYVVREAGRYHINPSKALPRSNVTNEKSQLERAQLRIGEALRKHSEKRGITFNSSQEALELILRFLEEQQIALLLGAPPDEGRAVAMTRGEFAVVAEFIHDVVGSDPALITAMNGILEGLVLYRAAFLPDLAKVERSFKNLTVVFDSVLVRQALGYEGSGPQVLVRETINLLKDSGVRCVVFDKSVQEIRRILSMYEHKLATADGRRSLKSVPMARYFLSQRYSPSYVQEMSALLEKRISESGLRKIPTPSRIEDYTLGEEKLAERLADPKTKDLREPRVLHDVDCVAGVLTLRRGHRSSNIEDARVVFATTAPLVIHNTRLWWEEDEREYGISPIVHIRSLANLAWLKKPSMSAEYQLHELIALCAAAMRPSEKTWERFIMHLESLHESQRISEDEVQLILFSVNADRLLHEAELDEDDPDDIDASTLDEVVDRVISHYREEAEKSVELASELYEQRIAKTQTARDLRAMKAEEEARNISEELRRRNAAIDERARKWANKVVSVVYWICVVLVLIGSLAVTVSYSFSGGWIGIVIGSTVILLAILEIVGVLSHLRVLRTNVEIWLRRRYRTWLEGDANVDNEGGHEDSTIKSN